MVTKSAVTTDQQVMRVSLTIRDWFILLAIVGSLGGFLYQQQYEQSTMLQEIKRHDVRLKYHDLLMVKQGLMTPEEVMQEDNGG